MWWCSVCGYPRLRSSEGGKPTNKGHRKKVVGNHAVKVGWKLASLRGSRVCEGRKKEGNLGGEIKKEIREKEEKRNENFE